MNLQRPRSGFPRRALDGVIAIVCVASLPCSSFLVRAQEAPQAESQEMTTEEAPKIPNDQLDSLVAPIALYPDAMLAQTLAASTYPLEVMQLDQWMDKNKNLKDKALADAVAKQPWDPSVQSMAAFPEVVQRMAENIQWMTDVGNAVLAQQKDVMDAVQRMRAKAQGTGNLKTGSEQKVETKTTQSGQQVIVVEQANPEAVYVPSYDPAVVYGAAPAEYPYYPYSYPGYQPGTALAWGSAIAVGGVWANNNWGNCDWDDGNVTINNNNNFNKNYNKNVNKGPLLARRTAGNTTHNTGETHLTLTNKQRISTAARQLAVLENRVVLAVQVELVVLENPAVRVELVVLENPAVPAVRVALAVLASRVVPAVQVALVVLENRAVRVVPENPAALAVLENQVGPAVRVALVRQVAGGAGKASGGGGKGGADKVGGHKPSAGGGGGGAFAGGSGSSAKAASSRGGSSMKGGGGKGGGGGGKKGGGGGGGKKGGGGGRGR